MKHSTQLIRSLLGLTVLLASCQVDDSPGVLSDSEAQLFVSEACNYYEQTISEAAEKSKLVQNENMSPGEVTPCWHRAHIKQDVNYEYVYVPIIAGNNYIRRVKIGKQGETKNYRIPISQTLCVRRDKTGNYDAAYVTIMPSLNYYRANKSTFSEKVIHDKSLYGNLSGYVVYNNIVSSKMIVADRVKSGKCLWSYSPATFKDKALSRKTKKEIFQNIHNIGMSLTRNTIDGGWLEEVEVTPEKCPICGENDSDDHFCSTEEGSEEEEEEEGDNYFPGGWGGGGSAPGGGGSGSQPTNIAPRAKALFRNSSMTDADWNRLESLLNKIMDDCMGEGLYRGLSGLLKENTISFQFTSDNEAAYNPGNNILKLNRNMDSNELFHEMLHAYQYQNDKSTASFFNAAINHEIETHYAQYLYLEGTLEYDTSDWRKGMKGGSSRVQTIANLSHFIDEKGNLLSGVDISQLDVYLEFNVVPAFKGDDAYKKYSYDKNYDSLSNFSNLRKITKNC